MIRRRQFLGSMAFWATAGTALPCLSSVPVQPFERLNWTSDVINMEPHDSGNRAPVVTDISLQPGGQHWPWLATITLSVSMILIPPVSFRNLDKHSDWIRCSDTPRREHSRDCRKRSPIGFLECPGLFRITAVRRHDYAIIGVDFSNDSQMLATVGFD